MKKFYTIGLVIIVILGILFMVWAFFLNKGKLTVNAEAPFTIQVGQIATVSCTESPCTTELAPGNYTVNLKKSGYRDLSINADIPLWGEDIQDVQFEFIPVLEKLGSEEDLQLFAEPVFETDDLKDTPIFTEDNFIAYMAIDPENRKQTLYTRELLEDGLDEAQIATSFIRTVDEYAIYPNIKDRKKIAFVDNTGDQSAVYLVDLEEKTKDNILSVPAIFNLKWIAGSDNFLYEGRRENDIQIYIYYYNAESKESSKVAVQTALDNVAFINNQTLIAATTQNVAGTQTPFDLEGRVVSLEEAEATPSVTTELLEELESTPAAADIIPTSDLSSGLKIVKYSFETGEIQLIKVAQDLGPSQKVRLSEDKKKLVLLIDGIDYQLTLEV